MFFIMLVTFSFKFKLKFIALKIIKKQMKFQGCSVKLNENVKMVIFILKYLVFRTEKLPNLFDFQ
jgi:hypothetical protein